jgi:methionine--tRNA ligase beta chain
VSRISKFENVKAGHKIGVKENLFKKIKLETPNTNQKPESESLREGFEKLNLTAGKISSIEKHPDSTKLYVIQVDLGKEKRQIVSGLQEIYKLEELKNKNVIVITNLKPAKLGGYDSNGMILAAESEKEEVALLTSDLKPGTNITCNKKTANNDKIINSKQFKKIIMTGKDAKVFYENKKLEGVTIDKNISGKIC